MKKAKSRSRSSFRLEALEARHLLTTAPVGVPDVYVVQEDVPLNLEPTQQQLIPLDSVWSYKDDGSDQGTAWRELAFDDASWASGPAQLGYGDGDEATVVSFGPDENAKYATTYFRHEFNMSNADEVTALAGLIRRDDGAVIFVNGVEVYHDDNVPANPTFSTYATNTLQDDGNAYVPFEIPRGVLVNGNNIVAVEIHQESGTSSDISFEFGLDAVIGQAGVLANDTDAEDDLLTARLISEPTHGNINFHEDGSFAYFPDANYFGTDSFTYVANDGDQDSGITTVTFNIQSVNDLPFADADHYHALAGGTLNVSTTVGVLNNDVDVEGSPLTAVLLTNPSNGTLVLSSNGSFTYTPNGGFTGTDTFTYAANDGADNSEPATVSILVTQTNAAPQVTNDAYSIDEDNSLIIDLPTVPEPRVVFSTNFDNGIPPEITGVGSLASVQNLLGLGNDDNTFTGSLLINDSDPVATNDPASPTILTLTNLPPHTSIDIGFLFAALDEWDAGGGFGGQNLDYLNVTVDGELVFSQTFDSEQIG
ncbi:MAG: tandem-95 repeat protein, partial [Planctomycetales bacterium]|nr:tandem-95 repeat protein [Planctomycetales bacterium]